MSRRSAVEQSPNRTEIDKRLLRGESPRAVSTWLEGKKKNPESISHTAINNYRKKHLNVNKEAVEKYQNKKTNELKEKAVDKVVSDLDALDEIIEEGRKVKLQLDVIQPDFETGVTDLDIEKAKIQAKTLTIRAAKVKHDIIKDDPEPINLNFNFNEDPTLLQNPKYIAAKRKAMDEYYATQREKD